MGKQGGEIAIYSRKSRFTGKGESIGNQVELCKAYIRSAFGPEYDRRSVVFEDEGFSGGDLHRPAFQKMMEAVHDGCFQAIVVYRLDRISRNIGDFAGLIDTLSKQNVSFISIKEQFDTSTPMGRAMMFIISVFSQLERETIAERIRDNMHELAKTGRWLGGNVPTGFRSEAVSSVSVDGKTRKSFRLVTAPEEAETVKMIFDLYAQTDSLSATEAELLRRRIKTKQGNDFTRFAIKAILRNPVYMTADQSAYGYFRDKGAQLCAPEVAFDGCCGIMAYNRTYQQKGKAAQVLPVEQWIIALGKHPGLIPSGQWILVQASLDRNQSKSYRNPRSNPALLTGVIFCACGERMYPKCTQRMTESGETRFSYVCKMKERSKGTRCDGRNADGNALDAMVMEQLLTLREDSASLISRLEKSRGLFAGESTRQENQLQVLKAELTNSRQTVTALVDALSLADTMATRVPILKRIETLSGSCGELEEQILRLEEQLRRQQLPDEETEALCQRLACPATCLREMTLTQKRTAVRELIHRVIWDGTTAQVILTGAQETDIGHNE